MSRKALLSLAALLRAEDTLLSSHVTDPAAPAVLGELAAAGSAAAEDPDAYALIVESVREGYLLHYGEPRLIAGADQNLRLLAGDYLYAIGLDRLAGLGNLAAVRELSDLISLGAQLHADGSDRAAIEAADELWLASVVVIATGRDEGMAEAKFALRAGNRGAREALAAAAGRNAAEAGIADALARARHGLDSPASDPPDLG